MSKAIQAALARQDFVEEVQALETKAHDLGLHVTGHALNRAKNALGWELAGDIEQAGRSALDQRPPR